MNKKQIVKVQIGNQTGYGICLDEHSLLLENGKVLTNESGRWGQGFPQRNNGMLQVHPYPVNAEVKFSNTRNVPPEIRSIMEEGYQAFTTAKTLNKQIGTLLTQMETCTKTLGRLAVKVDSARGLLQPQAFAEVFKKSLTGRVKQEVAYHETRRMGYHNCTNVFMTDFSYRDGKPYMMRFYIDVDIEKYFREASFIYEEYDGTIFLCDGAEKDANYKRYIKQYSCRLSTHVKCEESLTVGGDKDFLGYVCSYEIPIKKPLTKEYAKELARMFCGVKPKK